MSIKLTAIKNFFLMHKKIYFLLEKKIHKHFLIVIILLLISTFLEILTLSLIVPILSTFMETQTFLSNYITSLFPDSFLLLEDENKLEILLLLFVGIFLLKNVVSIILIHTKYFLIFTILKSVSKNLYLAYINKPYEFFVNFKSSMAMRNFQSEIPMFTRLIFSVITLVQDVALTLAIFVFLFIVNAKVTVAVFLSITIVGFIYFYIIKSILSRWAKSRIFFENLKIKNILESFQSIKEIKIFNKIKNSVDLFNYNNEMSIVNTRKERTLAEMPKVFFEIIILGIFILTFFLLIKSGHTSGEIITILGIYFFSSIRIMPTINRTIISLQNYTFCYPSMEIVYGETIKLNNLISYENPDNSNEIELNFENEIKLENVSFKYDGSNQLILKDLNLRIKKNSIIGIHGKTGNGKSTLMNIINGLLNPTTGSIYCDDFDIAYTKRSWQNLIGYVAQNVYLSDDTIENNIKFENFSTLTEKNDAKLNYKIHDKVLQKAVHDSGLSEFINNLEKGLQSTTGESSLKISGGQKQRIGIARAVFRNPEVLLLDESTSSLDNKTEKEILTRLLNLKNKMTIIIISHKKDNFKICDQVFELKDGKLYEDIKKN